MSSGWLRVTPDALRVCSEYAPVTLRGAPGRSGCSGAQRRPRQGSVKTLSRAAGWRRMHARRATAIRIRDQFGRASEGGVASLLRVVDEVPVIPAGWQPVHEHALRRQARITPVVPAFAAVWRDRFLADDRTARGGAHIAAW